MTYDIDTTQLQATVEDLRDALGRAGKPGDASDVVSDETRRVAVEMVKQTPPQTKLIGEHSILRDLGSLFSGADRSLIDEVGSRSGLYNIDTWITNDSGKRTHLKWDKLDPMGAHISEEHLGSLNKRGRAPDRKRGGPGEWVARNVAPIGDVVKYTKKKLKSPGRWKASWAATAKSLGVTRVASWIDRHISKTGRDFSTPKSVTDSAGLMRGEFPGVTFGSRAPGVVRQNAIAKTVVAARIQAIKKRIKLVASGYNRDLSKRMKIERKSKSSGQGGRYAIG